MYGNFADFKRAVGRALVDSYSLPESCADENTMIMFFSDGGSAFACADQIAGYYGMESLKKNTKSAYKIVPD